MKHWPPTPRRSHRLKELGVYGSIALLCVTGIMVRMDVSVSICGALMAVAMVVLFLGVVQFLAHCCCPHCGENFNIRAAFPEYCPHCGTKMED